MALQKLSAADMRIKKAYGDGAGGKAFKFPEWKRLPTGVLTLDVALGGGIPLGAMSLIYGNESSGKTSLCLRIAAHHQHLYPERKVCWIDVENSWDEDWVRLHQVDPDEVHLYKPSTAEEAADVAKEVAMSEDAGLVIVDSLVAMGSIAQLEKSAEQVVVSGAAKAQTSLLRNLGAASSEHVKVKQRLTSIIINQPREKIGFVMGNPEILPGPKLQNYQAFLKLRLTGKPVLKEKIAPISIYNDCSARIVKKKFPCIRQSATWQMATYPYEEGTKKVAPLEINNRTHAEAILTENGWLENTGTKSKPAWVLAMTGEVFPTKTAAMDEAMRDYQGLIRFFVDKLLILYSEEIKDNILHGKTLDGLPIYTVG